jgi:dihydroneopterin aldolase
VSGDRILIRDLQVFARHGLLPEEAALGQRFALDIDAYLDLEAAGRSDDFARTVGYDALIEVATQAFSARRKLIEAAAESVASAILARFPPVERVIVEVRKPAAAIDAVFGHVGVAIERSRR